MGIDQWATRGRPGCPVTVYAVNVKLLPALQSTSFFGISFLRDQRSSARRNAPTSHARDRTSSARPEGLASAAAGNPVRCTVKPRSSSGPRKMLCELSEISRMTTRSTTGASMRAVAACADRPMRTDTNTLPNAAAVCKKCLRFSDNTSPYPSSLLGGTTERIASSGCSRHHRAFSQMGATADAINSCRTGSLRLRPLQSPFTRSRRALRQSSRSYTGGSSRSSRIRLEQ